LLAMGASRAGNFEEFHRPLLFEIVDRYETNSF
jgi:hypothetical protein